MKVLLLFAIRAYRYLLSPWLGRSCRFVPSCSEYAMEAVERHGAADGALLAAWRVARCNPLGGAGLDQVPAHGPLAALWTRLITGHAAATAAATSVASAAATGSATGAAAAAGASAAAAAGASAAAAPPAAASTSEFTAPVQAWVQQACPSASRGGHRHPHLAGHGHGHL